MTSPATSPTTSPVSNPLPYAPQTASQTAGPFVHIGLMPWAAGREIGLPTLGGDIAGPDAPGTRIVVTGRVTDGFGAPVRDMIIEIWQADAGGIYPSPGDPRSADVARGFRGFGRVCTDPDGGGFEIRTIKPGPVPGRHRRAQAPHLNLWLLARGVNAGLATRMYFADEAEANAADPVLGLIDPARRVDTLLAGSVEPGRYAFDIRLQGEDETVFLDA